MTRCTAKNSCKHHVHAAIPAPYARQDAQHNVPSQPGKCKTRAKKKHPKSKSRSTAKPSKLSPKVPKRHQNWLQERSGGPKLRPRGQSWPQDAPKRPQIEAKRRPRPPKWRPRGTKWAPSWVQEVPKRGQEESKGGLRAPKMQSKSTSKGKKHTLLKI